MSSKFASIFAARKNEDSDSVRAKEDVESDASPPSPLTQIETGPKAPSKDTKWKNHSSDDEPINRPHRKSPNNSRANPDLGTKAPGRPPGKRSDPAYGQVTAYIRKDTHLAVQVA